MKDEFSLSLPLGSAYLTTVRLTVGGICALAGLDIDKTEDIKVCVTEGLLLLSRNGFSRANVFLCVDGELRISLSGEGERERTERADEDEISYALLAALSDDASFTDNGNTFTISLINSIER
ncbi:MAG: hypothetical protein J5993_04315 [Clostridia bacterium]|nr:hypothetical protein [Clostridia bacterium]